MSVRIFLDKINIWIHRPSKAESTAQYGWVSSNLLKAWIQQKGGTICSLSSWLFLRLSYLSSPTLGLELRPSAFLVLRPVWILSFLNWNYTTSFLACRQKIVALLNLCNHVSQYLTINICIVNNNNNKIIIMQIKSFVLFLWRNLI